MATFLSKLFAGGNRNTHRSSSAAISNSPQMGQALDFIKDVSHIIPHVRCIISINPDKYSTAIDAEVDISDISSFCSSVINDFENFKKDKIAQSVAGKIDVPQMSSEVGKREKAVNEALMSSVFGGYRPSVYPFLNLREFLKSS